LKKMLHEIDMKKILKVSWVKYKFYTPVFCISRGFLACCPEPSRLNLLFLQNSTGWKEHRSSDPISLFFCFCSPLVQNLPTAHLTHAGCGAGCCELWCSVEIVCWPWGVLALVSWPPSCPHFWLNTC
jgi:hypothetical protein